MECFCIRYANKIGGMVESQTRKKLNLSAPVDETVDLFIALIKLITISLTHHITNKVIARYRKNSIVNLQLEKPSAKEVVVKKRLPMSDINIIILPNGWRYPLVGRKRTGNGKPPKLRTSPKNAQSPSRPVHALLDAFCLSQCTHKRTLPKNANQMKNTTKPMLMRERFSRAARRAR